MYIVPTLTVEVVLVVGRPRVRPLYGAEAGAGVGTYPRLPVGGAVLEKTEAPCQAREVGRAWRTASIVTPAPGTTSLAS